MSRLGKYASNSRDTEGHEHRPVDGEHDYRRERQNAFGLERWITNNKKWTQLTYEPSHPPIRKIRSSHGTAVWSDRAYGSGLIPFQRPESSAEPHAIAIALKNVKANSMLNNEPENYLGRHGKFLLWLITVTKINWVEKGIHSRLFNLRQFRTDQPRIWRQGSSWDGNKENTIVYWLFSECREEIMTLAFANTR